MFICEVIGHGLGNLAILFSPLVMLQKQTYKSQNTQVLYYWPNFIIRRYRYKTRILDGTCAICEV